jgi:pimeloyl-ACP methyl ester carboxylesterase
MQDRAIRGSGDGSTERSVVTERMIQVDEVELCTDWWGDPADSPVLLIMGLGTSMVWWPDDFCRALADGGRFVVRYDHRDTGRSISYPLGNPGYTGGDLVSDVVGILDAYELPSAHLVGVSAGGAIAQTAALDHPGRVLSLVLISTSPAPAVRRELPPPTDAFGQFFTGPAIDWSDPESVIDYRIRYTLMLAHALGWSWASIGYAGCLGDRVACACWGGWWSGCDADRWRGVSDEGGASACGSFPESKRRYDRGSVVGERPGRRRLRPPVSWRSLRLDVLRACARSEGVRRAAD